MKTTPVTPADLAASVLSVPPLARRTDLTIDSAQNARLLDHLRSGGVRTFMYGGNANLYSIGVGELGTLCDLLVSLSRDGDWIIPSVGSDYGKACDQLKMLRDYPFATAMVLPHKAQSTPAGVATGIRRLADIYGKSVIAYVKDECYVEAADMGRLAKDGVLCAIKYAIVREHPLKDPFLGDLVNAVDRSM
ncbi:MAG: dihydrodipicolinate synthase family protein, partial [Candidatus Binataceae bacterium]